MKILAIEADLPDVDTVAMLPLLKAEATRVWDLVQAGVVREIYFRADRPSAVLILECANVEEAEQLLATLPLVQARLIAFDIIPLAPYPGFGRLFA
jgi:muconolactone delta-isomerase